MGNILTDLFYKYYWKTPMRLLMLGLDGVGKTTLLYKLRLGEVVDTIPTIGFNAETVEHKNFSFTVWDCGGGEGVREYWLSILDNTDGLIYVVDSTDSERMAVARDVLRRLLIQEHLKGVPVLVLANKQDMLNALSDSEVTERLELKKLQTHKWYIQSVCAITGQGVYEGLEWLSNAFTNK